MNLLGWSVICPTFCAWDLIYFLFLCCQDAVCKFLDVCADYKISTWVLGLCISLGLPEVLPSWNLCFTGTSQNQFCSGAMVKPCALLLSFVTWGMLKLVITSTWLLTAFPYFVSSLSLALCEQYHSGCLFWVIAMRSWSWSLNVKHLNSLSLAEQDLIINEEKDVPQM